MSKKLRSSFLDFLQRNRLGIAPQGELERFCQAFLDKDVLTLAPMVRDYLGFGDLLSHFEDLSNRSQWFPSHDEMRRMSDAQYCAMHERTFAIQGALCDPRSEAALLAYLMQWSKFEAGAVADIGGGTCHQLSFLKLEGKIPGQCIGLDGSSPIIRIGKQIASVEGIDVSFVKGICTDLPFLAGSIGQIWMVDVLPWVMGWKKSLRETSRVLIPGGRIILAISCTGANARSSIEPASAVSYLEELGFKIENITRGLNLRDCIAADKR